MVSDEQLKQLPTCYGGESDSIENLRDLAYTQTAQQFPEKRNTVRYTPAQRSEANIRAALDEERNRRRVFDVILTALDRGEITNISTDIPRIEDAVRKILELEELAKLNFLQHAPERYSPGAERIFVRRAVREYGLEGTIEILRGEN